MISRRLVLLDAVVAVPIGLAYQTFAAFDGSDGSPPFTGPAWLGWLVAAAVGVPVAFRRRWPLVALVVVVAGCVAASLLDISREPFVPAALVLYIVGTRERHSVPAVVSALVVLGAGLFGGTYRWTPSEDLGGTVSLVGAVWLVTGGGWAAGLVVRRRRLAADQAAADDRLHAATEERLRIAREIHDVVSHTLSMIAVQAGVANHLAAEQPEQAQEALRSIEATSRGALVEMRAVLNALREEPDEREPTPGMRDLPRLVDRAAAAGLAVELTVDVGASLPAGLELAVFRIVQESLTNVVKHAAPARCAVKVTAGSGEVAVRVTDDGGGPRSTDEGGHGLAGLRERVLVHGGDFTAGPRSGGGFQVYARMPRPAEAGA